MEQHIHRPWDPSSAEFFEFAKAVTELGKGRRRVEVLRRGKYWAMYKVVRDNGIKVGYINWYGYGYLAFVKINLAKSCVIYFYYPLVEMYKLTEDDFAVMKVKNVADLLQFISSHVRDSSGRTPCHLPITEW
jgi:hypothetical protein